MLLPPLAPERARQLVQAFGGLRTLVVGDAMVDTFTVGRVTRISPEAPVPVVAFEHETHRIGGAANVAHNITALGGRASLVAVTGRDDAATRLAAACQEAGISPSLVADPTRSTTTKVRIVTERNQQVARIDYETVADIGNAVAQQLIAAVQHQLSGVSAIIVSDYLTGSITRDVMRAVVTAAAKNGIPLLIDPKVPHLDFYSGSTVVTPNHHETEQATSIRIRSEDDAREAARAFRERAGCDAVLMTRGDQGMWLLGPAVEGQLPASAREVADVTGAGDTVIAVMALGLAAGAALDEAARLANEAAGISVAKFGPSVVTPAELMGAIGADRAAEG